jgi:demethylmenaquinone methyltransferase/2-methoxy-6-polyprenyl-1,4-benzoquinol methylase
VFEVTERGDVFVDARLYDWRTKLCMLGALSRTYRRVAELVAAGDVQRMLDVGTGTGAMAFTLKRRVPSAEVHGVDPGERMLDVARTNGVRERQVVHFRSAWAQDLPFAAAEFDVVTFAQVLRHIPLAQRPAAMAEAWRVTRPGGCAVIVEVVPSRWAAGIVPHRGYGVDLDGCGRLLRAAGFADVRAGRMTRAVFGYAIGRRRPRAKR